MGDVKQFLLGLVSVTPQILLPLAGDLARPEKRASALSIVLAGLLLGLLFGRVLAGVIAQAGTVAQVYFMSAGLQVSCCPLLALLKLTADSGLHISSHLGNLSRLPRQK